MELATAPLACLTLIIISIERVQKVVVRTILREPDIKYEIAPKRVNLVRLDCRRKDLCLKYAKKCVKSPKNNYMFPKQNNDKNLRKKDTFLVPHAKTDRFRNSAIPYMTSLLNKHEC